MSQHAFLSIRSATPDYADRLTELALASKAYWGYDEAFMARSRPVLTVTPEYIEQHPVIMVTRRNVVGEIIVLGFASLREITPEEVDLDLFFVDPKYIGQGVGAFLFANAFTEAMTRNYKTMIVEADPNAESFYVKMGMTRYAMRESNVEAGRYLPLLRREI